MKRSGVFDKRRINNFILIELIFQYAKQTHEAEKIYGRSVQIAEIPEEGTEQDIKEGRL